LKNKTCILKDNINFSYLANHNNIFFNCLYIYEQLKQQKMIFYKNTQKYFLFFKKKRKKFKKKKEIKKNNFIRNILNFSNFFLNFKININIIKISKVVKLKKLISFLFYKFKRYFY
jgi:hypothetical protein